MRYGGRPTGGDNPVLASLSVLAAGIFIALLAVTWISAIPRANEIPWAADFDTYMSATRRFVAGGDPYLPFQLAGPYRVDLVNTPILYPPTAFLLFVPFTLLPPIIWWLIPVGTTVLVTAWHRPKAVAWPAIAACAWFPSTSHMVVTGNPGLWAVAALSLGTRYGWPSVGVLMKPSLAPFALVGITGRRWWVALLVAAAVSLPLLPLWTQYVSVLRNAQANNGVLYSVDQIPAMLMVVAAWIGSSRRGPIATIAGLGAAGTT